MKEKSSLTTLCHIEKDNKYLMMHRVKKENDLNKDKWVGIGGHFEEGESPEECLVREVLEETGLILTNYRLRGVVTFVSDEWGCEYMFIYTATEFTCNDCEDGKDGAILKECNEGTLEWIEKSKVYDLPIWAGDKIFFRLLEEDNGFFSLKLQYEGDTLTCAILDGEKITDFEKYGIR